MRGASQGRWRRRARPARADGCCARRREEVRADADAYAGPAGCISTPAGLMCQVETRTQRVAAPGRAASGSYRSTTSQNPTGRPLPPPIRTRPV